ncbi:MAG: ankyrin repeat domain-containing protein [Oscillospiraceae bacterium]|nr:ankyrin repeat domain-containing protein [Oscillospiraceae bacterium]
MSNIKDHILSLIAGVPFAVIAVVAVVLILHAIRKIRRKAVGAGMLIAGICLFCPSLFMTLKQSNTFLTGVLSPKKSLSYAVEHLDAKAVKALLENGTDPDAGGYSFFRGNYEEDIEEGTSPVAEAIAAHSPEKLKLLLDYGASLKPEYLADAVKNADPETLKVLLERGADPDAKFEQTSETVREHIKKLYQQKIEQNKLTDKEQQVLQLLGIV